MGVDVVVVVVAVRENFGEAANGRREGGAAGEGRPREMEEGAINVDLDIPFGGVVVAAAVVGVTVVVVAANCGVAVVTVVVGGVVTGAEICVDSLFST